MDKVTLNLESRTITGKTVKNLRKEGLVPGVIHDHGKESIVVAGPFVDVTKAYKQAGKHHTVEVTADGKKYNTIIKSVTFDPHKNQLNHIVFGAVSAHEKVTAEIPVHMVLSEGNDATPAERAGLIVLHQLESVEVEAESSKLPDELTFDGEKLVVVGDHVTVADLTVPAGVVVKAEENQSLATVFEPSALQAANDAAGGDADEEAAPATDTEGEKVEESK
jgi:large subunit ribosomal protein L25